MAKEQKQASPEDSELDTYRVLMPSSTVEVAVAGGVTWPVRVWPLGVIHLERFNARFVDMAAHFIGVAAGGNGSVTGRNTMAALGAVAPFLATHMLDVLTECCRCERPDTGANVPLRLLPAGALLLVAERVVSETFGTEEQRRGWRDPLERIVRTMSGGKWSSISAMLSSFSRDAATGSTTSSTESHPASRIAAGP